MQEKKWTVKTFFIKLLKIVGWFMLSLVLLLYLLTLIIQVPAIQDKIVQKAVSFVEKKIGTHVSVDEISLRFPKEIVIKNLYVQDQAKDTLLFFNELDISTDLWSLIDHRIQLNHVAIQNLNVHLLRNETDSSFNFSYIITKFTEPTTVAPADTMGVPWQFTLKKVELQTTKLKFKDAIAGTTSDLLVGTLLVSLDSFDMTTSIIKADKIELAGIKGSYVQSRPSVASPASGNSPAFDLGVKEVDLSKIDLNYSDESAGQSIQLNIGRGAIKADKIDLKGHAIALESFSLDSSLVFVRQMRTSSRTDTHKTNTMSKGTPDGSLPWQFSVKTIALKGNTAQYYDFNQPVLHGQADPYHLWISNLSLNASAIEVKDNSYQATIGGLTLSEKNGFMVRKCQGILKLTDSSADVKNLVLVSGRSNIRLTGHTKFSSLNALAETYPNAYVNLKLDPSVITVRDLLYFNPALLNNLPIHFSPTEVVRLDLDATGAINDLAVSHIKLGSLTNTLFEASGKIKGLPDIQHALLDIDVQKAYTTRVDVKATLPDSLLPQNISVPEWVNVKGHLEGSLNTPQFNVSVSSDAGEIAANGRINFDTTQNENYHGVVDIRDLKIGQLLRDTTLGNLTMTGAVGGHGFRLKTLNALIDLNIADVQYHGYHYKDFKIQGKMDQYLFSGNAAIKDKNLDFDIKGELDYRKDVPSYNLTFDLRNADFKALRLAERPLKARGTLNVKLATTDFKVINGSIAIRKVGIFNGAALYTVDSLLFASIDTKGQTDIKINSDILDGSFQGTIHLLSLPQVIGRHFNSYFSLQDTTYGKGLEQQNFKFNLVIKKNELITEIILPSLRSFEPSPITGAFNSEEGKLDIHVDVKRLRYDGLRARTIAFDLNSNRKSLNYDLNIENLRYDSLRIPGLKFEGKVAHDSIKTKLVILDSIQKNKYAISAVFNSLKDEFQFKLIPDQVMLNYEKWTVPDNNYLRFGKKGIQANNFSLTLEEQKISLEANPAKDSTVLLIFNKLDLSNIFNIVSGSSSIVQGKMDGRLRVFVKRNNAFNSNIKINDLQIMKRPWGDVVLSASQLTSNKFEMELSAQGEHTDIKVKGDYTTTKPASVINLNAEIAKLDMMLIEPFSSGQLRKSSGNIKAQVNIKGTLAAPKMNGELQFQNVTFTSTYVNSAFTLKNESLKFTESGLTLSNFKVLDDNNNVATFKGAIQTKDYKNYTLDLGLTTKNFRVLNTTAANNSLYYGKVKMNATAKVSGTLNLPVVDLQMGFSNDSEFNYVVPVSNKGVLDSKGIVKFIDKRPSKDPFLASLHLQDTVQNIIKGFDVTANIELRDAEKFNIIIDPKSGDKLAVQGNTNLIVKIDPSGNMNLSGQYEITKGSYSFSFYKLVKRDFEILKGGTIVWSGDPMDATLNLQALYKVETSPLELMSNQSADLTTYRQAFPFLVYLYIKGEIGAPEITFRLDMPEASKSALGGNVYAAIQDINTREPDLNKQVFSLLVLKRFMADNPFENQATTSLSSNARSSVSGILSDQLNRLSQNVKGVTLNFDVKSYDDYSSGVATNQTKLQLGVSKSLLHDKLVVKLSGNVDIAGENSNQSSLTDYIGDLALEYKITSDGRLRLTGFRNSDYDMIDGDLTKTGAGLIYIKDYNTLKELFKANVKEP